MMCDNCKRNEANIHVSKTVNGVKYEQNLCMECAGITPEMLGMFSGVGGLFQQPQMMQWSNNPFEGQGLKAPNDGMNEGDFEAMGLKLNLGRQQAVKQMEKEETLEDLKQRLALKREYQ